MSLSMSIYSQRYTKTRKMTIACQLHWPSIWQNQLPVVEDESFFRLNFNIYSYVDNRPRARPKKITNFFLRETWTYYSGGGKMWHSSGQQGENEGKWKNANWITHSALFTFYVAVVQNKVKNMCQVHMQSWFFANYHLI